MLLHVVKILAAMAEQTNYRWHPKRFFVEVLLVADERVPVNALLGLDDVGNGVFN